MREAIHHLIIQCDQIGRLFLNIWPFTLIKICQIAYKICQSGFKSMPNSQINSY